MDRRQHGPVRVAGLLAFAAATFLVIGYLERGGYDPSLALAFRLSDIFGLPIEEIFVRGRPGEAFPDGSR